MQYKHKQLWIAFKICIFDFQKQLKLSFVNVKVSCELLSKFVSLTFRNSNKRQHIFTWLVVNCFQNLYLWLSETAAWDWEKLHKELWIAFKICIFDFQKQQITNANNTNFCCELLSKFVSLTFRNSTITFIKCSISVVNCFQNLYLWLSETAQQLLIYQVPKLWIAFKICIFDFQKQLNFKLNRYDVSCELLSKFVSLTFRNSEKRK